MSIWLVMILGGVLTYLTRLSFIALLHRLNMPDWFQRGLRFVPVAVLSALILPELTNPNGTLFISWRNAQLLAGVVAIVVAWRTKNVILTLVAGMVALLAFQFILGRFSF